MSTNFRRLFSVFTVIFAAGLCVTVPLVVYLILYSIDPSTHFYYDNAKLVPAANGILIALTVVLIIPIFAKRVGTFKNPDKSDIAGNAIIVSNVKSPRSPVIAAASLLMGFALCFVSADEILHTFVSHASGVGNFLTGLSGFLAAIFFFAFAGTSYSGKRSDLRIVALLPVLWGVVNLVSTFMSLTQVANISQYLYKVLQMVFAILFLYYNARLVGGVSNGREVNGVFAFGLPCAFFGLLSSVPPVIAHLMNKHRGNLPQVQDAVFIMMSLYILVLLISLLIKKPAEVIETPMEVDKPET